MKDWLQKSKWLVITYSFISINPSFKGWGEVSGKVHSILILIAFPSKGLLLVCSLCSPNRCQNIIFGKLKDLNFFKWVIRNCHNGKGTSEHICTNGTIPLLVGDLLLKKSLQNSMVEDCLYFHRRAKSCIRTLLKLVQEVYGTHGTTAFC